MSSITPNPFATGLSTTSLEFERAGGAGLANGLASDIRKRSDAIASGRSMPALVPGFGNANGDGHGHGIPQTDVAQGLFLSLIGTLLDSVAGLFSQFASLLRGASFGAPQPPLPGEQCFTSASASSSGRGGSIETTLRHNGAGGVDVENEASRVDLGGYLVDRTNRDANPVVLAGPDEGASATRRE